MISGAMLAGSDDLHRGPASMAAPTLLHTHLHTNRSCACTTEHPVHQATTQYWHRQEAIGMHQGYAQKASHPCLVTISVGLLVVRVRSRAAYVNLG